MKIVAIRFVKTGRVHQHEDSSHTFRKDRKSSPTRLLSDAAQSARSSRSPRNPGQTAYGVIVVGCPDCG